jgi:hypothetical protein
MPLFLPHFVMKTLPSTMSFLYHMGGKMEHTNPILKDATNEIQWSKIKMNIDIDYSWDEYTSTVKNIRIYKGLTSTISFLNYKKAQLTHGEEICDDPNTKEEWSTISHYMNPRFHWEDYVSTMADFGIDSIIDNLKIKTSIDILECENIFNSINRHSNISEWVIFKRNLYKFLSTPSLLERDYKTAINNYPIKPATLNIITNDYISSTVI